MTFSTGSILGGVIATLASPIGLIALAIAGLVAVGYLFSDNFNEIFSGASIKFGEFVTTIGDWCSKMYTDFVEPVITNLFFWFNKIWEDNLKGLIDGTCGFVARIGELLVALGNFFLPIVQFLGEVFGTVFTNVFSFIIDTLGVVINTVLGFASGFIDILSGITDFLVGVFTLDFEKVGKGISEVFGGLFKVFVEFLKGIANIAIWALNMMIEGIYTVFATIYNGLGSFAKTVGNMIGKDWDFSMPAKPDTIPYLARGGIIDQPTLAMIGERGREAVMPLENNTGWITDLANQIGMVVAANSAMSMARQSSVGGTVNLYLDGRKFAEATIDDFSSVANRRGINILSVT